jgi:hypothetical protein
MPINYGSGSYLNIFEAVEKKTLSCTGTVGTVPYGTVPNKSLNIIKYRIFFLNFFESLIISRDSEPDPDPGGQLITIRILRIRIFNTDFGHCNLRSF